MTTTPNYYDQIAAASGVDRETVKKVLYAVAYTPPPTAGCRFPEDCMCKKKMGNDFFFLPIEACLKPPPPKQGWTGRKCMVCAGTGRTGDNYRCDVCAGTGAEYGDLPGLG